MNDKDLPLVFELIGVLVSVCIIATVAVLGIGYVMETVEDRYFPSPYMFVSPKYTNVTTLYIEYDDPTMLDPTNHFHKTKMRIDNVTVILDDTVIAVIPGSELEQKYWYTISPSRHSLEVLIYGLNGKVYEHTFTNRELEGMSLDLYG